VDVDVAASVLARRGLTREQVGWLGEQDLDRAILLGSRGRLHPYLPVVDSRRVDRAYAWDGIGQPWFVQVKGKNAARSDRTCSWTLRAAHFTAYERMLVVPSIIDVSEGRLRDPVWCVPADDLVRLAFHGTDPTTGPYLEITASLIGRDSMSRFRTTLATLWERLAPAPQRPTLAVTPSEFPALRIEQGAFYELSQMVELLRGSEDDLLPFRPASDISGRDLLIQRVDSARALYLQIKGTARLRGPTNIHQYVRRKTFVPAEDFWLGFYRFDRPTDRFFPDCWLVPSLEFARRTAEQRDRTVLTFDTSLIEAHDRWREFRHPIGTQAAVIRAALKALPAPRPQRA
jgi:hypothetical protein